MKKLLFFFLIPIFLFSQNTLDNLKYHIKYLTSEKFSGRMTGSGGAKEAAQYISKNLGEDFHSFQVFSFLSGNKLGKNNSLKITYEDKTISFKINKDYVPLVYSSSTKIEGEGVFLGYGISAKEENYDDYENIEVEGKIVLVLRFNPYGKDPETPLSYYDRIPDKIITARDKGAKGFIIFTGIGEEEESLSFKESVGGTDLGIPALQISQEKAREIFEMVGQNLKEIEEKIIKEKKPNSLSLPNLSISMETELIPEKKVCQNVIGILKPKDENFNGKYILLGAHYDHIGLGGETSRWEKKRGKIHPGADDNASGVSLLMELYRSLKEEKEELRYGLIFAFFSGEELGIIGSTYFVKNPVVPLKDISLMLNFDMVGRMRDKKLILIGLDTSPQVEREIDVLSKNYDLKIIKSYGGFSQGDNSAFYKEEIPVLGFFTDVHPDYHMPSDTYEKINYLDMGEILKFAKEFLLNIQKMEKIEFTPSKAIPEKGGKSAMRVYVGTIPSFGEEVEGYKISGVQPGSPAEKGGLKKDDIIIKVNEREVKNIYDYMSAFKEKKAGDEVVIIFIRNGETKGTKIILAPSKEKEK